MHRNFFRVAVREPLHFLFPVYLYIIDTLLHVLLHTHRDVIVKHLRTELTARFSFMCLKTFNLSSECFSVCLSQRGCLSVAPTQALCLGLFLKLPHSLPRSLFSCCKSLQNGFLSSLLVVVSGRSRFTSGSAAFLSALHLSAPPQ